MKKTFNVGFFERSRKNFLTPLKPSNRKYILFPNDNAVTSSLINGWIYEPYLFEFFSDNQIDLDGTEILDIGANNGHFTVEFANYVGDEGKVYSFEPQRIIFQQLCGNVFLNGLDNVYTYNVAVGHENGTVNVEKVDYHNNGYVNFGDVHIVSGEGESVPIIKVDDMSFNNISVIKIDVQGFEQHVISGAVNTINKFRPFIFVEVENHQLQKYGFNENTLAELFKTLNYTMVRFQKGIPYQTESGECLDCICIPNERLENETFKIR
jgi:FkbM family methyltransferase